MKPGSLACSLSDVLEGFGRVSHRLGSTDEDVTQLLHFFCQYGSVRLDFQPCLHHVLAAHVISLDVELKTSLVFFVPVLVHQIID